MGSSGCGCGAKRISKARISNQARVWCLVRCCAVVVVRVLSKVDKQRLGAWLGAVRVQW